MKEALNSNMINLNVRLKNKVNGEILSLRRNTERRNLKLTDLSFDFWVSKLSWLQQNFEITYVSKWFSSRKRKRYI